MRNATGIPLLLGLGLVTAACGGNTSPASSVRSGPATAGTNLESALHLSGTKTSLLVAGQNIPQQVNTAYYLSKSIVYVSQQDGSGPTSSILLSENGGSSWNFLSSVPGAVSGIDFVSKSIGYLVSRPADGGPDNFLYLTTNGGSTWSTVYAGSISAIKFLTPTIGFAMLRTPSSNPQLFTAGIYRTSNGGRNWSLVPSTLNPAAAYGSFSFSSASDGWLLVGIEPSAGSENKYLYKTTDAGANWSLVAQSQFSSGQQMATNGVMPATGYVTQLQFISSQQGFMSLMRSGMYATDDGGSTWNLMSATPMSAHSLRNVVHFDAWSRTDFSILTGNSNFWQTQPSGLMTRAYPPYRAQGIFEGSGALYELSPAQGISLAGSTNSVRRLGNAPKGAMEIDPLGNRILAFGTKGLYQSSDGSNWKQIPLPKGWTLIQGRFVDSKLGFVVANDNGPAGSATIERTTDGGASWNRVTTPFRPLVVDPISANDLRALGGARLPATSNPAKNIYQMEWNLYSSSNGGKSWSELVANWRSIGGIDFLSAQEGYAWADNYLYHTTDAGHSFVRYTLPSTMTNQGLFSMAFAQKGSGWALAGTEYPIYHTADGGATWRLTP
ncbi:MAG: hypothetical protein EPN30_03665 [Actinomycetota bacterium]|nr:MAG: hypothetical protein EPN30_03665 [Actinomycetota bacterium]